MNNLTNCWRLACVVHRACHLTWDKVPWDNGLDAIATALRTLKHCLRSCLDLRTCLDLRSCPGLALRQGPRRRRFWSALGGLLLWLGCTSCSLPQVQAEDRLFLPLSVDFLDEYRLPIEEYKGEPVGGLSAIAYDRRHDRLYALSDDRGNVAPPRFYTLRLRTAEASDSSNNSSVNAAVGSMNSEFAVTGLKSIEIESVEIESVTYLAQSNGEPFPINTLDPEGLVLSPEGTVFISSEGVTSDRIPPSIAEFDLTSGRQLRQLPLPPQYRPSDSVEEAERDPQAAEDLAESMSASDPIIGVQNNKGFEALALSAAGMGMGNDEPFRVFAGIEEPLLQDTGIVSVDTPQPGRILHYVVSSDQSFVLSEHVYPIDPLPFGAVNTGLVELMALGTGGNFLSLERSYGLGGVRAKLFQTSFSDATDTATLTLLSPGASNRQTSGQSSDGADGLFLEGDAAEGELFDGSNVDDSNASSNNALTFRLDGIQPMRKQLLLDLYDVGIRLDNLEGMTLGPRLPDGSRSLILVSDNNFNSDDQITQFLLFRIHGL